MRARGFTLIEMLVALAVLAVVTVPAFHAYSGALLWVARAAREQSALTLAQTMLDRAGADISLTDGAQSGETQDGLRWALSMAPYGTSGANGVAGRPPLMRGVLVDVTVSWTEQRRLHEVHLSTVRLIAGGGA